MILMVPRECYACGAHESYFDVEQGYEHWYSNHPINQWLCENCNNKFIKNPKWHPITNKRLVYVRGKGLVYLPIRKKL